MKKFELILMVLQVPIDFLLLLLAATSAYFLRFSLWAQEWREVVFRFSLIDFLNVVLPVAILFLILFAFSGLYSTDQNRKLFQELQKIVIASAAGLSLVALYLLFKQDVFDSRFLVAISWGFSVLFVSGGRVFMRFVRILLYRFGFGRISIVIIGNHGVAGIISKEFSSRPELGYSLVKSFDFFSQVEMMDLLQTNQVDEIIFTNPRANSEETLQAIDFCNEHHITFKYSADIFDTYSTNMAVYPLAGIPVIELKQTRLDGWGRVIKRLFDILVSVIMLIITAPIMLLTAVIIFLETGQPIIYKNERVGQTGKNFFTYKFRSMYQKDCTGSQFGTNGEKAEAYEKILIENNNTKDGPVYKIGNDPRVTPFGKFIRRWSIDELPQFWNSLIGNMSVVGPRPHQPREVANYTKHHKSVLTLKPGITGISQVSGRSDLPFEEEVKLDIFYIENWSVLLDLIIFLKTPFILFKKRKVW